MSLLSEAIRRVGATRPVVSAVCDLMRDGTPRTDEWIADGINGVTFRVRTGRHPSRQNYLNWSQDTVRHARLALQQAGMVSLRGWRRTRQGGRTKLWKATAKMKRWKAEK